MKTKNPDRYLMDNLWKKLALATLCTKGLKKSLQGWIGQGGQDKEGPG